MLGGIVGANSVVERSVADRPGTRIQARRSLATDYGSRSTRDTAVLLHPFAVKSTLGAVRIARFRFPLRDSCGSENAGSTARVVFIADLTAESGSGLFPPRIRSAGRFDSAIPVWAVDSGLTACMAMFSLSSILQLSVALAGDSPDIRGRDSDRDLVANAVWHLVFGHSSLHTRTLRILGGLGAVRLPLH